MAEDVAAPLARERGSRRLLVWGGVLLALAGVLFVVDRLRARSAEELDRLVTLAARRHRLDPALVRAVVEAESGGNPRAASPARAYGLMQLRVATASEIAGRLVTIDELYEPAYNLELGCRYLRRMLRDFDGDLRLALMAYNAGPSKVERWRRQADDVDEVLERIAYRQTRAYVKKVLRLARLPQVEAE